MVRGSTGIVDEFVRGEIGRRIFLGRRVFFLLGREQRILVGAWLEGTIISKFVERRLRQDL